MKKFYHMYAVNFFDSFFLASNEFSVTAVILHEFLFGLKVEIYFLCFKILAWCSREKQSHQ
jgi:hypothetical protein